MLKTTVSDKTQQLCLIVYYIILAWPICSLAQYLIYGLSVLCLFIARKYYNNIVQFRITISFGLEMPSISLGFVEQEASWHLDSYLFPDKVGGRPAWLALDHLPSDLHCPHCHQHMVFLLQLYSPIDDKDDCFHRTLFVFMCKNGKCFLPQEGAKSQPFRVFRSQLPKDDPFYR